MHQLSSTTNRASLGASTMLLASLAFAGTNVLQSVLPWVYSMSSTGMAFWQYVIATVFALPLIARIGISNLRTSHPWTHEIRAFVSALGVHVFVYGFVVGVPVWQMVTLLATGPLFVVAGSLIFLKEKPTFSRVFAATLGFIGAIAVSGVGSEGFTAGTLVPVLAAALWATTDVLTKALSRTESPETLTVSLLVLLTPNHLLILVAVNALGLWAPALLPPGLANGFPFQLPQGWGLVLLGLLGLLTAAAQYLLAYAYKVADATFLQPFGDLKVPLTALLGWVLLGQVPSIWFWPGAALVLGASLFLYAMERRGVHAPAAA